jgi:uncharacterized FlaG/YvyC family protein
MHFWEEVNVMSESMSMPLAVRGADAAAVNYIPSADKAPEPIIVKAVKPKADANLQKRSDDSQHSLEQKVETVNKMFQNLSLNVSFELDKTISSGVRIIMRDGNNNVVREIPSRQFNTIASKAKKSVDKDADSGNMSGLLVDSKV